VISDAVLKELIAWAERQSTYYTLLNERRRSRFTGEMQRWSDLAQALRELQTRRQ